MPYDVSIFLTLASGSLAVRLDTTVTCHSLRSSCSLFPQDTIERTSSSLLLFPQSLRDNPLLTLIDVAFITS